MSWARGVAPDEGDDTADSLSPSSSSASSSFSSSSSSSGQKPARIAGNFLNRHKEGRSASAYFVANESANGVDAKARDPRLSLKILLSEEEEKKERGEEEKEEGKESGSGLGGRGGGGGRGMRVLRPVVRSEYSFDETEEGGGGERPDKPQRRSKNFKPGEVSAQMGHFTESHQAASSPNLSYHPRPLPKSPQSSAQQPASPLSRQMAFSPEGEGRGRGGGGGGKGEAEEEEEEEKRVNFSENEREILRGVDCEEFLLSHNLHQYKGKRGERETEQGRGRWEGS